MSKIVINDYPLHSIEQIYADNKSIKKTSEKIQCSTELLYKVFKQYNISILKDDLQIIKLKEDFFLNIDSDVKAYWLGFIFVKGQLSTDHFRIEFELDLNDKYHISKFCDEIGYSKSRIRKDRKTETIFLKLRSEDFFGNIHYYIGNQRKLSTTLSKIPENLINSFIRGYFDGSGLISYNPIEMSFSIKFVGVKRDLELINKHLPVKGIILNDLLSITGLKEICNISDYLYDNCSIRLLRNYNKFTHYKKVLKGEDLEQEGFDVTKEIKYV